MVGISTQVLHKLFYFLFLCAINPFMAFYADGGFSSIPHEPREVRATEARLEKIYEAAKRGLKGDALALACDMLPTEYRRLIQLDPIAEYAEIKGRAEGEMEMADVLRKAAIAGDTKAALDVLKHVHNWVAKQAMSVEVNQTISITAALQEAQQRVIEGQILDANDYLQPRGRTAADGDAVESGAEGRSAGLRQVSLSVEETKYAP